METNCYISCAVGRRREKKIIFLTEMKQNDPRQTYLHISAPTYLQFKSLWQEITTSVKLYGKTNIMKNKYAVFLQYEILKPNNIQFGRVVLPHTSVYFAISKLILYFHTVFMYHGLYFPTFVFTLYIPCFPFFLIDHNWKQVLLIKWVIFFLKLKNFVLLSSTF